MFQNSRLLWSNSENIASYMLRHGATKLPDPRSQANSVRHYHAEYSFLPGGCFGKVEDKDENSLKSGQDSVPASSLV
jgi:hypothetical protein